MRWILALLGAAFVGVGILLAAVFGVLIFLLVLAWRIVSWPFRLLAGGRAPASSRATYTHQGIEVEVIPPGPRAKES